MKTRLTLSLLAASLAIGTSALALQPAGDQPAGGRQPGQGQPGGGGQPGRGGQPGGGRGQGQPGRIDQSMKQMNGALKELKDNISKADKKDDNLNAISQMQRAAVNAKNAKPTNLKGTDLPKAQEAFRRAMIQMLGMMLELETQVMDGKTDQAQATLKKIEAFEEKSHEQFAKEDGKEGGGGDGGTKPPAK
ncbi:MAG: cytochrome b562 [Phycisphaerales bacterium]